MKKIIFAITFAITGFLVNAQMDLSQIKLGVKIGGNLSSSFSIYETSPIFSFHAGGYLEAEFSEDLIFRPEILYSSEGFKFDTYDYEADAEVEREIELNYLSLVMLLKYEISSEFGFEGGGTISYLLSSKQPNNLTTTTTFVGRSDELAKIDLALTGGIYYLFENGLNFSLRYNYGLKSIYKMKTSMDSYNPDFRRSLLQLSVGYTL